MKRFLAILVSVLLTIVLVTMVLLYFFVNAERVENYAAKVVGDEFDVMVGTAVMNPFTRNLTIRDITIYHHASDEELFMAKSLEISRIGILKAVKGNFSAGSLVLQEFYLDQRIVHELPEHQGNGNDTVVTIGNISLLDGELALFSIDGSEGRVQGLNFRAGSLTYNTGSKSNVLKVIKDAELEFSEGDFTFWDGRYHLRAEAFLLNEAESAVSLDRVTLSSPLNESDFFKSLEYRTELFLFELNSFRAEEIDFSELRDQTRFTAGSITLDSLDLHVTLDKAVEEKPDKGPVPMPLQALDNLPIAVALDEIVVRRADIRYSEYDEDGERPGTIYFGKTEAGFKNIHSGSSEPVEFSAWSYLEGTGELKTEITFLRNGGQTVTEVEGSLGSFDVKLLNNIFKDLEGIEINDGIVHNLDFSYRLNEEKSEGTITIHYDDFSMKLIDRVDHNQGFRNILASFFMDEIALRASSSHSEGDSRTGEISEERNPEKGFFNYLWVSLRSGILDVVKRI